MPLLAAAATSGRDSSAALAQRARAAEPRCSPISTARSACCATACCRRSWCSRNPGFLRPCHGVAAAGRPLPAPLRRRPRARARRPLVGARRSHAGAVGRGLRAREPHRAVARRCPSCSASAACSGWPASSRTLRDTLRGLAPRHRDNPRIVAAHARALQRDLLRARLPRALPRLHAGRGRRPHGARPGAST